MALRGATVHENSIFVLNYAKPAEIWSTNSVGIDDSFPISPPEIGLSDLTIIRRYDLILCMNAPIGGNTIWQPPNQ